MQAMGLAPCPANSSTASSKTPTRPPRRPRHRLKRPSRAIRFCKASPSQQSPVKMGASAAWHDETGSAPALVSRRARFFDLIVLGRSERVVNQPHTDVIEQTLVNSGRPVLLAPSTPPTNVGEAVAVGWNGSAEATRALAASLPFLVGARIVSLITVGDKHQESAAALIEYLAWHGIKGQHRHVPSIPGTVPGQQLLSTAREEDADLLVMGHTVTCRGANSFSVERRARWSESACCPSCWRTERRCGGS